jgi:hypothetical protein
VQRKKGARRRSTGWLVSRGHSLAGLGGADVAQPGLRCRGALSGSDSLTRQEPVRPRGRADSERSWKRRFRPEMSWASGANVCRRIPPGCATTCRRLLHTVRALSDPCAPAPRQ